MRRPRLWSCFPAALAALALASVLPASAAPVTVVTSIKPVHSLVAAAMQGAGTPHLIVEGGASPHSYSLKPSDAAALEEAKVVVWVGESLETFLASSIATLAQDAEVVELSGIPGLKLLPYRAGGAWEAHEEEEEHDESHGDGEHGETDMHLWLDPDNAKAIVAAVAEALTRADPDNSGIYLANTRIMSYRLDQLVQEVEYDLAPVKDAPFVVFHDAFQYFDTRFALNNVGSVTVDPDRQPGAARLKQIRAKVAELGARCVFAEPQFEPRLLEVVTEGTQAKVGLLDPLGADIPDGPELYFELLRRNAAALKDCLG
ncbi:zinc ABC transporter substrate-binding protein [Pelagibius marinus]|uniref:zinc ABC transporter substrate-binding protein n=1 Tax=Pelagibius marinus TaxID=2762760 RepID=UPI0018725E4F|nr:zinc ABC transporter substrate-binding protein [Pelagibius marinus]